MSVKEKRVSSKGAVFFTILALMFTIITAWLLSMMLAGSRYAQEDMVKVVAARRPIDALKPIEREDLKEVLVPASSVPAGSFASIDSLLVEPTMPPRPIVGLFRDEIVIAPRLADAASGWGLASRIPHDDNVGGVRIPMRAMTVRVDGAMTLARLLFPGAVVDVLATVRLSRRDLTATQTILQGIEVLAVDTNVDAGRMMREERVAGDQMEIQESVVALLVTPEQAEQLTLAMREGRIDLVLRNTRDDQFVRTPGVQIEDLVPGATGRTSTQRDESRRHQDMEAGGGGDASRRILQHPRVRRQGASSEPRIEIR